MNNLIAIHLERNGQTKTVLTEHQARVWLAQGWTRLDLTLTKPGVPITHVLEHTAQGDPDADRKERSDTHGGESGVSRGVSGAGVDGRRKPGRPRGSARA